MENRDPVSEILLDLEEVLKEEHQALRVLDRDAIEAAAERKLDLDARLLTAVRQTAVRQEHRKQLERIQRSALQNQLLLVHARSCVQGVLSLLGGEVPATYPGATPSRVAPGPIRLDVRG